MSPEAALFASLLLLIGNAFFVGAEFSMVSVRRSAIEPDAVQGSKRALITLKALENISFLMAGAQLGITTLFFGSWCRGGAGNCSAVGKTVSRFEY